MFILPLAYMGGGAFLLVIKLSLLLLLGCFAIAYYRHNKDKRNILFFFLFALMGIYIYRTRQYGVFISLLLFVELYILFLHSSLSFDVKKNLIKKIYFGCLFAGLVGFAYMYFTNNYIKGGTYTKNDLNLSNLTVPLYLCLFILYSIFKVGGGWKRFSVFLFCILLFGIVIFLEKRGPVLFLVLSIVIAFIVKNSKVKSVILVVIFAFPLYELPITEFLVKNKAYYDNFVERTTDFDDVERNPRIKRLMIASVFVSDFEPIDLIGYHKELSVSDYTYDKAHNHFHNTMLQLYYERGLISVIIVLFLLIFIGFPKNISDKSLMLNYSTILFLFLVGTNEDILKSGSLPEVLTILYLLYATSLNKLKKCI